MLTDPDNPYEEWEKDFWASNLDTIRSKRESIASEAELTEVINVTNIPINLLPASEGRASSMTQSPDRSGCQRREYHRGSSPSARLEKASKGDQGAMITGFLALPCQIWHSPSIKAWDTGARSIAT